VAKEIVAGNAPGHVVAQRGDVRLNEHGRSPTAADVERLHFAIAPVTGFGPIQPDQRIRFCGGLDLQPAEGVALPVLESPHRELAVGWTEATTPGARRNEVSQLLRDGRLRADWDHRGNEHR